ncbi:MAG: hypothetical protein KME60_05005 [Cyanomargarita calcarea GSE-NOS-MK-12-04C]|uniref:Uncharacterized protein n=1 Tax=Cyanomargarita calcarea GSE-NOS-MK-12-04C TaxID=2839659 RepID=A0A951QJ15_9CYAN|nr:hypothetical protein [Cyanomargarita calcarea GSE-NOS-MK-12-04C]
MDFDLILNELSLRNPAPNEQIAGQLMSEFIKTVKAVKSQGVKVNLRTKENFHTTTLAPNYPLRKWFNDADQVERQFIKNLATKTPFSTDIANLEIKDIENSSGLSEFICQRELAIGLGVAHLLNTIAISLVSEDCWDCNNLYVEFRRIDEDGEVIDEIVNIIHISRSTHVQKQTNWIQNRIRTGVLDGVDLWNRREELFSNLIFCESVGKQIESLNKGEPILEQVKKRLFELEEYCQNWVSGSFNPENFPCKVSPESDSRLKQLKDKLTFKCPDEENRTFSWHIRMTPGAWRLHFFAELEPGKIIIGYVGLKIL